MATMTAEQLIQNKLVQKYIANMDKDADAALKLAKQVIGSSTGKLLSSTTLGSYKKDVARLEKAQGEFALAWNMVAFKKAKDSKQLIKTYSRYVLALTALDHANAQFAAMMTAGFALCVAALLKLLQNWIKAMRARCKKLEKDLQDLRKLVKKAQSNVTGAQAQTALNILVTGISFCLGPVGWGARIGVALGGVAVHTVIDASLGPSQGSAMGTVNTVSGESVELVDKLSKGSKKMLGGASAVLTLKMDTDEIAQAEKILKDIRKRARQVQQDYEGLLRATRTWKSDIAKAKKQYDQAYAAFKAAEKSYKDHGKEREQLLKEFKKWK